MHRPFRFTPPTPGANAVLRPRLLEPLSRRFELRLITVEAGAGLGKTTLLAQAMAENRLSPRGRDAWLTCEPADSSPSILLGSLLEAVGTPATGAPPTVRHVCEAIWAAAPAHVCLVLDDAQHIEAGSKGEAALRHVLVELPENGHLLVAARRLPDLARSRLVLQGRTVELSADQLALDEQEAAALAASHGTTVDVVRTAGGWPALAELHARLGTADARRFVWEEVVAPLPPADRDALLFLVAVGSADVDALVAATGAPFDRGTLAALPLVAVDDGGGLRPHPIWEELLRDRIDPVTSEAARRALAEVLATRGAHGDAFELFATTGAWERALEVVFDACNAQHRPPWRDQMARWEQLLPPSVAGQPEAIYLRAMIERAGDAWSDTARESFAEAIEGFRARGDQLREIVASVRSAQVAWLRGDRAAMDDLHDRSLPYLDAGWPLRPVLALNRATAADIDGRVEDVLAIADTIGDTEPRLRHFTGLVRVFAHLAAGDAGRATGDAA
ncbi:MAG: transcriptional activator domain protein, partial [Actinomycetia bacterium]|nr:transcriptional activator domain protein [Actinomycetes bacterium]